MDVLPDKTGMVSASADKRLKFWQWAKVASDDAAPFLGLELHKTVNCEQDVLCVRVSEDGKVIVVSLISNVIKVQLQDADTCQSASFHPLSNDPAPP
jgi:U3 small nucleolar RNA-associated protein 12